MGCADGELRQPVIFLSLYLLREWKYVVRDSEHPSILESEIALGLPDLKHLRDKMYSKVMTLIDQAHGVAMPDRSDFQHWHDGGPALEPRTEAEAAAEARADPPIYPRGLFSRHQADATCVGHGASDA